MDPGQSLRDFRDDIQRRSQTLRGSRFTRAAALILHGFQGLTSTAIFMGRGNAI
jgi:hypothetical protein